MFIQTGEIMKKIIWTVLILMRVLLAREDHNITSKNIQISPVLYGTVLEIKEVMGYDYLKVDANGTKRWIAIAKAPIQVGDRIGYDTRTVIKNFKSKNLNRVSKEIIFANEVYLPQKVRKPKSMKEMLELNKSPKYRSAELTRDFVSKPFYTVEELHRYRKNIEGKEVTVKAKVHKVSHNIMKRDWVHLEDGTGNEEQLTDDIVFTTKHTLVKAGDNVIAKGKIAVDKDFGYGYFYPVLGEDALFKKNSH